MIEQMDFYWIGAFMAVKVLIFPALWCLIASVINRSIS